MTTITRYLSCTHCDASQITLVTVRDETGHEYIDQECLKEILQEQEKLKRTRREELEIERTKYKKLYPNSPENEIEPHYDCFICGTSGMLLL